MKQRLFPVLCCLVLTAFVIQDNPEQCGGVDRWSVKVLTDTGTKNVSFKYKTASVSELRLLKPSKKIGDKTPRLPEECLSYSVLCKIREFILEDDGDYHLVLMDLKDTTLTMIAEIPDTSCASVRKSKYANKFGKSRAEFEKYQLKKGKVQYGTYRIKGVAFFDQPHKQKGVAPNGIEIHPVTSFVKTK